MFVAMREAERQQTRRSKPSELMTEFRVTVARVVGAEQERGTLDPMLSPDGIATLLAAVGDGLVLHRVLDPTIDVASVMTALRSMISRA